MAWPWQSKGVTTQWPDYPLNAIQNSEGATGFWAQLLQYVEVVQTYGTIMGWTWQQVIPSTEGGGWNPFDIGIIGTATSNLAFESAPDAVATSVAIVSGGTSYAVGDTITLAGGTSTSDYNNPTILYVTSSSGPVTGISIQTPGTYDVAPTNPVSQASTSGIGSGATFNLTYTAPQAGNISQPGDVVWMTPGNFNTDPNFPLGLTYIFTPNPKPTKNVYLAYTPVGGVAGAGIDMGTGIWDFGFATCGIYELPAPITGRIDPSQPPLFTEVVNNSSIMRIAGHIFIEIVQDGFGEWWALAPQFELDVASAGVLYKGITKIDLVGQTGLVNSSLYPDEVIYVPYEVGNIASTSADATSIGGSDILTVISTADIIPGMSITGNPNLSTAYVVSIISDTTLLMSNVAGAPGTAPTYFGFGGTVALGDPTARQYMGNGPKIFSNGIGLLNETTGDPDPAFTISAWNTALFPAAIGDFLQFSTKDVNSPNGSMTFFPSYTSNTLGGGIPALFVGGGVGPGSPGGIINVFNAFDFSTGFETGTTLYPEQIVIARNVTDATHWTQMVVGPSIFTNSFGLEVDITAGVSGTSLFCGMDPTSNTFFIGGFSGNGPNAYAIFNSGSSSSPIPGVYGTFTAGANTITVSGGIITGIV